MSFNPDKSGYPQQPQPQAYGQPGPGYPPMPVHTAYTSNNVVVQQPQHFAVHAGVRPADYLVLSIIAIFFCWPMAICAIMYSLNSKSAADVNDFARAESEGRTARNIGIAAIIISVVIIVISVAVPLIMAASVAASFCTGLNCDY